MSTETTWVITNEGYTIGTPVRAAWVDRDTRTERSGIVVPIRTWAKPIGGFDEGDWPYADVRAATDEEAAPILATEAYAATLIQLASRFTDIVNGLNRTGARTTLDLSHIDISDVNLNAYREDYREDHAQSVRSYRHIRQLPINYTLPSGEQIYLDPDNGVVWRRNSTFDGLWAYPYTGELAEATDTLTEHIRRLVTLQQK